MTCFTIELSLTRWRQQSQFLIQPIITLLQDHFILTLIIAFGCLIILFYFRRIYWVSALYWPLVCYFAHHLHATSCLHKQSNTRLLEILFLGELTASYKICQSLIYRDSRVFHTVLADIVYWIQNYLTGISPWLRLSRNTIEWLRYITVPLPQLH
jgi:hypothetical protein